jgi:hypothetical protein
MMLFQNQVSLKHNLLQYRNVVQFFKWGCQAKRLGFNLRRPKFKHCVPLSPWPTKRTWATENGYESIFNFKNKSTSIHLQNGWVYMVWSVRSSTIQLYRVLERYTFSWLALLPTCKQGDVSKPLCSMWLI